MFFLWWIFSTLLGAAIGEVWTSPWWGALAGFLIGVILQITWFSLEKAGLVEAGLAAMDEAADDLVDDDFI